MPATKDQIKRIELLDELLGKKKWSLKDLLDRVNSKLIDSPIDQRTLYRDLKYLEDEKQAPIHRPEKGDSLYYYTQRFSLKQLPLDDEEVAMLRKAIDLLKQGENHEVLNRVEAVITKLENKHTSYFSSEELAEVERGQRDA